jgi:type I restriction enzyme S subunit
MDKYKLNQLGSVNRGKSKHRPRNDPALYGGVFPFIQTGDVKHSPFYVTSHTQTYNDKGLHQSKLWPSGTLCITIAANIGDTAILTYPACFPDSIIGFLPHKNKADVKYVKYCLDTFRLQMQSISQGTTQDNMSLEKLLSIEFPAPELRVQQKIAAILSAYDDLIENNKRRIVLLENMAEEIYREWFVRFRFPGYQTAEFEKGIPKGWVDGCIGDIYKIKSGYAFKSEELNETGEFPVIKIGNIGEDGINVNSSQYFNGNLNEKIQKFELHEGDFLVAMTGAQIGKSGLMPPNNSRCFLNQRVGKFYSTKPEIKSNFFINMFSRIGYFREAIEMYAQGAAQPNISGVQIENIKMLIPSINVIVDFENLVNPLFSQIFLCKKINDNLSYTKEILLPRLISGKLSVEDLDIQFPPSMQEDSSI